MKRSQKRNEEVKEEDERDDSGVDRSNPTLARSHITRDADAAKYAERARRVHLPSFVRSFASRSSHLWPRGRHRRRRRRRRRRRQGVIKRRSECVSPMIQGRRRTNERTRERQSRAASASATAISSPSLVARSFLSICQGHKTADQNAQPLPSINPVSLSSSAFFRIRSTIYIINRPLHSV